MNAPANPALALALKSAGVAPTLRRRLWTAIKNNPGLHAGELHRRFCADATIGGIGSSLAKLEELGYVYSKTQRSAKGRMVNVYYTDLLTYDDPARLKNLPTDKHPKVAPPKRPDPSDSTSSIGRLQDVQKPDPTSHGVNLENLTVAQLRALVADIRTLLGSLNKGDQT